MRLFVLNVLSVLGLLLFFAVHQVKGQEQCGTTIDSSNVQYIMSSNAAWHDRVPVNRDEKVMVVIPFLYLYKFTLSDKRMVLAEFLLLMHLKHLIG